MTGADTLPGGAAELDSELVGRVRGGERAALGQLMSRLESHHDGAQQILSQLKPYLGGTAVYGVTGPPGAGKSTLVNALICAWRAKDKRVGIIAVDPSSPVSGGAILGDRIRMIAALDDDGVFVRSLASGGHLGGLSPAVVRLIDALDAARFDVVLIETVGTGQNEVDISAVADVRIVVMAPGLGDDIQAMKSGLLEIADVLVVNKADRADAEQTLQQLMGAASLRHGGGANRVSAPAVLSTIATRGVGVRQLVAEIERLHDQLCALSTPEERRKRRGAYLVRQAAIGALNDAFEQPDPALSELIETVLDGQCTPINAAFRVLDHFRTG